MEICGVFVIVYRRVYAGVLNIFFAEQGTISRCLKCYRKVCFLNGVDKWGFTDCKSR